MGMAELWQFLKERKKWWLLPMILVLLFLGLLLVMTSGTTLGPFIYTLF
jgi:competence protein ComGC